MTSEFLSVPDEVNVDEMNPVEPHRRVHQNGTTEWLFPDGTRHRVDGPAVTYVNGAREWWWEGVRADGSTEYALNVAYSALSMDDLVVMRMVDVSPWVAATLLLNPNLSGLTVPMRGLLAEIAVSR